MSKLNYDEIEKIWQKYWSDNKTNKTVDDFSQDKNVEKKKFYILDMFPYPSGEGLHVGHPKGYIATDVYSRLKKMQGYNVLHPMGWDAFGLPAEQFAIKNKINPNIATAQNVARYKEQIEMLGINYDWDREINTTDPKYYKWTQWMFKQMYKDGMAYESFEPINWCPSCKTGLSNEDLDGNACERCGTIVEKKPLRQWVIKITDYADRLLADLDKLNWETHIKELQRNWIGKSVGSEIDFEILNPNVFGFDLKTIYDEGDKNYKNDRKRTVAIIRIKGTNKFLGFQKPNDARIYLPGGGKEFGENCIENAIRETREEIGITKLVHISPIATFRNGEYYELFEIEENYKTLSSELDKKGNSLIEFTKEEILKNDFAQVSYIFNNLEHLVEKSFKENKLKVFTTRADTLFGCTFMCISYTLAKEWIKNGWDASVEIKNFIAKLEKEEKERTIDFDMSKLEKEGVDTGIKAINPANGEEVPIYIANYVLSDYGTGAIMAVPAHDARDFEFAKKYNLEIREVIRDKEEKESKELFEDEGVLINSADFSGMNSEEARVKITEKVGGKIVSQYKLKDWVFARQRYWGEPFPIVFDENRTSYSVADKELPVILPNVENYEPTDNGESPLANIKDCVEVYGFI
ncbi:MAG: leucyl-tRNA synthetase, partial [Patescibacteria group bacterium]|nr:leucyl-tRNA synthetase [Patescibacteria group bacterium]